MGVGGLQRMCVGRLWLWGLGGWGLRDLDGERDGHLVKGLDI